MQPLRDEYVVRSYEADPSGFLAPGALLRYMQESAWNHARALGVGFDPREGGAVVWVLARLRLEVARFPAWGERVVVETWPVGVDRLLALRDFRLLDAQGALMASATTGWMIIDAAARRPRRPEQLMPELATRHETPIVGIPGTIEPVRPPCEEHSRRVLFSDIDLNRHVNNVRYLDWVMDGLPAQRAERSRVAGLEAAYLSEALLDQEVAVRSAGDGEHTRHTIVADGGTREVCRLRLRWVERPAG